MELTNVSDRWSVETEEAPDDLVDTLTAMHPPGVLKEGPVG